MWLDHISEKIAKKIRKEALSLSTVHPLPKVRNQEKKLRKIVWEFEEEKKNFPKSYLQKSKYNICFDPNVQHDFKVMIET